MNTISLIHLSDIHFERNEPENQGLVISAFFNDLNKQIGQNKKQITYCIISGDLVNKGARDIIYERFYTDFIIKLCDYVPLKHIFVVPGNHDLDRHYVEKNLENHESAINAMDHETAFNDYVKSESNIFAEKFKPFADFCINKLGISQYNHYGYSRLLIPELSIFCLNSALCSSGGFNEINDDRRLKIETSELNKWIQENDGRTKVLVMHHPIEQLTNYAQTQLNSILRNNEINVLITGHTHNQDVINNYFAQQSGYLKCSSPQLFSTKADINGYAIFKFEQNDVAEITYRQWSPRQRKFLAGQDFSSEDTGIIKFEVKAQTPTDTLHQILHADLQKSMRSYSKTPSWVERFLSTNPPNSQTKGNEERLDYLNLINSPKNYQIIAAKQFGLTCYAKYLALKAWDVKKEHWLYFDTNDWRLSKVESDVSDSLNTRNIEADDVTCILLDHWNQSIKDSSKILAKLKRLFFDATIIILSNYHDTIIIEGLDTIESHDGFTQLYLKELDRCGLRTIVRNFNNEQHIAEEDQVICRLQMDLVDLNIHRTPLNCLQLLLAFISSFEDRPVNRSRVFDYLLKLIFDNPGNLFYGDDLDENNCRFILGYFCECLLREDKDHFTETEFLHKSSSFSKENYNNSNISNLLQILKNNQIIIEYNGVLKFRFSYWVYYFAAQRMRLSSDFANYMFSQKHSIYYPEIIEFYTGTDGQREDAVSLIIRDLEELSLKVHNAVGIPDDFSPFEQIKWAQNETTRGITQEQLEDSVRKSKLPDEIKDVIADKGYNSVKPYSQTINNFFDQFYVKNLLDLTTSASRALRNSEFVSAKYKEELSMAIFKSWGEIIRVLLLIAPVLAKNGFGGLGGARFKLSDDFPKEYGECLKRIVIMMPYNIMNWYKDDLFSDKVMPLFEKYLSEYPEPVVRHIIAILVCSGRPRNYQNVISAYISTISKNSYYLGDLYTNLSGNYSIMYMTPLELRQTENLIKACWVKHHSGVISPGKDSIAKASSGLLPERQVEELD